MTFSKFQMNILAKAIFSTVEQVLIKALTTKCYNTHTHIHYHITNECILISFLPKS